MSDVSGCEPCLNFSSTTVVCSFEAVDGMANGTVLVCCFSDVWYSGCADALRTRSYCCIPDGEECGRLCKFTGLGLRL